MIDQQPSMKGKYPMRKALAMVVGLVIGMGILPPAAQAAPGCPANWFCLHDTSTSQPHLPIDVYDTALNDCIGGILPITSYVTNNTGFRWIVSTSNDCSANRGVIYPHSQGGMGPTWNNNIRGIYRTSSTSFAAENYPSAITNGK